MKSLTIINTGYLLYVTRLRAGRPRFESRLGHWFFLVATASRSALGPTQAPIYATGAGGLFPRRKAAEARSWPFASTWCRSYECV